MSIVRKPIDLRQVPYVPWAWVAEHVYAAIRGCGVAVLRNERRLNIGCPFRRINGTSIRYKMADIAVFLESQPGGGSAILSRDPSLRSPVDDLVAAVIETASGATLAQVEREYVLRVFRQTGGVVTATATRLGIPRTTLYAMMKKLEITRSDL
jgi:DNA-binding NtrC family response regulator